MNSTKELGAPPIPYGPHAVGEALESARRLAGALARGARRASGAVSGAVATGQASSTEEWIRRFEPGEVL
jgi:hypothetical protein